MDVFKKLGAFILDILQTVVLALSIFMLIYLFGTQPHEVRGSSMVPNFQDGEYLLTDKLSYRFREPKRGDVIVFAAPPNRQEDFIKRIVALPGESIDLKSGEVHVNGKPLAETYLPRDFRTDPGVYIIEEERVELGPNEYLVFGDNRNHSLDSRSFGPIKKEDIVGRAWLVYWPPDKVGIVPSISYAGF